MSTDYFRHDRKCPFCEIAAGRSPATIVRSWEDAIAIVPLNPVTEGHVLVIPHEHVQSFYSSPDVSAMVMKRAASLGHGREPWEPFGENANIITSVGPFATQTVKHLHVHVVPRRRDDGLCLPWSPTEVEKRLAKVEAVAHEPQPIFSAKDFQALARRVEVLERHLASETVQTPITPIPSASESER